MSGRGSWARGFVGTLFGLLLYSLVACAAAEAQAKPEGEMRWALYVTIAPAWLDPGEVSGFITPFWIQYAIHDALVKPMPGNLMTPSLAESWTLSPDQRVYEFKLRQGLRFHNGDPFTAEDVKFSFYRAKSSRILKEKVRDVEIVDPHRVRFHLHEPFPDFMAFYGTLATASSWVVPKKYVEKVGDEGFKKHPIGLGPYKFVSHTPGVELIMEANESYWRKMPSVKRLVYKSVPEPTTRAAMLKKGEVDIAYLLDAPTALELKRDPNLKLAFSGAIGVHFIDFFDQWDPKSPWHDRRVRLAANLAIDRRGLSEAETLGASRLTGAMVPRKFEFALPLEAYPHDPAKAKQLLAEAGYPNGFDAGNIYPYPPYFSMGETVGERFGRGGHQDQVRDHGARGVPEGVAQQEPQRRLCLRARRLWQRGVAHGGVREHGRVLRARRRPGRGCALQAAGARDRPQEARGYAAPDPAAALRARAVRPDLGVHLAERDRPAGGRPGPAEDRPIPVVRAAGGRDAQDQVTDVRATAGPLRPLPRPRRWLPVRRQNPVRRGTG